MLKLSQLIRFLLLLAGLLPLQTAAQFYNGSQLTFGKNRVQYRDFFWTYFRYEEYDTYFYEGGRDLAIFVSKYASEQIPLMAEKMEYQLSDKVQFILFNRLSDLKQSNIGLISDAQYNVGGVTYIQGNKVFLYFDGSHRNLEYQIRAGLANVMLNELIYGSGITTQVKNNALINLPEWYSQGLVSYLADPWNTEVDEVVRDGFLSGEFARFNRLSGEMARYAGHSLWKFVADKYGKGVISNVLSMTRVSRNVESGFLFVIGVSFKTLTQQWQSWYGQTYLFSNQEAENPNEGDIFKRTHKEKVFKQMRLNPGKGEMAYVVNELGRYKVILLDLETGKKKVMLRGGNRLDEKTDLSYPLLAWHPSGRLLAIILEHKGEIWLYYYDFEESKLLKEKIGNFQKVRDFAFSPDGLLFTMSAVLDGQSDIFTYNRGSRTYERITNDNYDDLDPRFIEGRNYIIFASNRHDDTLRFGKTEKSQIRTNFPTTTDIFIYDYRSKSNVLRRVTNTPLASESQIHEAGPANITYLSDQNGISNLYVARFDSAIAYVDTIVHYRYFSESYAVSNFRQGIREIDLLPTEGDWVLSLVEKGRYRLILQKEQHIDKLMPVIPTNTVHMNTILHDWEEELRKAALKAADTLETAPRPVPSFRPESRFRVLRTIPETPADSTRIDFNNYRFSGEAVEEEKPAEFRIEKARNYDVEYSINQLVNQVDFSYLNYSYQPFSGGGSPLFINPGFNALFKIGLTDLMEDYRLTGSIRPSVDIDNMEYFFSYESLGNRLDRQLVFHRVGLQNFVENYVIRQQTHELIYALKWPFSPVAAVKGSVLLRNDRGIYQSFDLNSLKKEDIFQTRYGIKGEFIYDHTRSPGLNLHFGTRAKVFAEYYQSVEKKGENLVVAGFDLRHYQRLSRTLIWANRLAASSSFGNSKLIYYMGGVDNWLIPRFNTDINIDATQNYAYQTLATNMRGFWQNARNGNSFALINSEIRFPVFRYLSKRPLKSQFLNNFMLVGFGDVGSAWTGWNPYSEENSLFKEYYEQGPIKVTVKNQKNPVIGGMGLGLRSTILGYYVRLDYAWGIEDGIINDPLLYLSFSLDF
jgi:hypothetical protein